MGKVIHITLPLLRREWSWAHGGQSCLRSAPAAPSEDRRQVGVGAEHVHHTNQRLYVKVGDKLASPGGAHKQRKKKLHVYT